MSRSTYTLRLLISLLDGAWSAPGDHFLMWNAEGDYAGAREILKHVEADHPPFTE